MSDETEPLECVVSGVTESPVMMLIVRYNSDFQSRDYLPVLEVKQRGVMLVAIRADGTRQNYTNLKSAWLVSLQTGDDLVCWENLDQEVPDEFRS